MPAPIQGGVSAFDAGASALESTTYDVHDIQTANNTISDAHWGMYYASWRNGL
jgi:hypothetical protein